MGITLKVRRKGVAVGRKAVSEGSRNKVMG